MLELVNVRKTFNPKTVNEKVALDGLNLRLADGDFVVGNAKNYKLNFVKPTEIYPEIHGKTRVIEYTAHVMVAGKAAPNKFYYGKKANA